MTSIFILHITLLASGLQLTGDVQYTDYWSCYSATDKLVGQIEFVASCDKVK